MKKLTTGLDPIDDYASGVADGSIPACRWIKKAIERHFNDLKRSRSDDFPYYFEPKACLHILEYFTYARHWRGEWAGERIFLEDWQIFIVGSIFGWISKSDNTRRFREAYIEVPRKNGKTTLLSVIGLYGIDWDNEYGSEVFCLATTKKQAYETVFKTAKKIVERSPRLNREITVRQYSLSNPGLVSTFQPLSKEHKSLDGMNTHIGIFDELHAWESRELYDVIDDSTGAREQPLLISITTAGTNRNNICYEIREYVTDILNGVHEDERFFGMIYTIDKGDRENWNDPKVWQKANPNYGVSVKPEDLERLATKAERSTEKKNDFLTKRLNVWISSHSAWANMDKWNECIDKSLTLDDFAGKPCYIGLDLASKLDLTSLAILFRIDKERYALFWKNYLPEAVVEENLVGKKAKYNAWADEGHFTLTDGEITDYDVIEEDIYELNKKFRVLGVGFDPYQATQLITHLNKRRIKTVEVGQTVKNMSEPMKNLAGLYISGNLVIPDDPVASWAMSNVVAKLDRKDNIFPTKDNPENKIDPIVAGIITLALDLDKKLPLKFRAPKVWTD